MIDAATGKQRVVLVTGAAGGVGTAIARAFAAQGAQVIVSDIDTLGLERLREEIAASGGQAKSQVADLSTRDGVRDLAARCGPIDVLVNNAALTQMQYRPVIERNDDFWDKTFAIDLFAPITLMQALVSGMVERGGGHVINISSVNASRGTVDLAPYAAAKAALEMASKVAAMELAMRRTNVRVNCIAPGLVGTAALARNFPDSAAQAEAARQLVPLGRVVEPREIAELCLFLASDRAAALLGTVITLDGGMNAGAYALSAATDYAEA